MPDEDPATLDVSRDGQRGEAQWFALWVRSHCEQLVRDQLTGRGFQAFLPTMRTWSHRGGNRHLIRIPMFPGYLFLHQAMDKGTHVEILKTRGLVRILGERWDQLAPVADSDIQVIQRVVASEMPVLPHPYLRAGHAVRITEGPLAGLEGILVLIKAAKGLLVVSVELLKRSVAVEVDCTRVVSIGNSLAQPRGLSSRRPGASSFQPV